jgi:hypothetical protein
VSSKYIWRLPGLDALEVLVPPDIGDLRDGFRQAAPPGSQQRFLEDGAMLGFRAPAVPHSAGLQGVHDALVQVAYDQAAHRRFSMGGSVDSNDINMKRIAAQSSESSRCVK